MIHSDLSADPAAFRLTKALRATFAVLALALASSPAAAEPSEVGERHITVSGRGQVSVRPDVVRVRLGVRVKAVAVGEAMDQNRTSMTLIVDALRGLDVDERDIITSNFTVFQERRRPRDDEDGGEPDGKYVVSNMVTVTVRDLDQIDDVLEAATEAGANQVHGIHFDVEKTAKPGSRARRLASEDARIKATELAKQHGAKLGPVLRIRELGGGGPSGPRMAQALMRESAGSSVSVGDLQFSAHLEVVYGLQ